MMTFQQDTPQGARGEDVVHRIISLIADQTDTDGLALPPLGHTVDTDALVTLVKADAVTEIEFSYNGHDITIGGDGQVNVAIDGMSD